MKKTVFKLSMFCLAFAFMSTVAPAQVEVIGPDTVDTGLDTNPGFEEPGSGKITNGFNAMFPWENIGTIYNDSGCEELNPHSGLYRAYEDTGDPGAYQITTNQMSLGDEITLSWWALGSSIPVATNPPAEIVGLISAPDNYYSDVYDPYSSCTVLAATTNNLTGNWVQYTVTYTAQAADVGKYIGCYFITTNAMALATNSYGGYDDFFCEDLPSGSKPVIQTAPTSQTAYKGASVTFMVSAFGATSYQWIEGVTGSNPSTYTNLLNGGQYSGVNTAYLTMTNLTSSNNGDYAVVCANAFGSVTSTPAFPTANLSVQTIIYQETFTVPDPTNNQSVGNVGWINDVGGSLNNRIFSNNQGVNYPYSAVYSYVGLQTNPAPEAFYYTTTSANGGPYDTNSFAPGGDKSGPVTGKQPFPGINLSTVANLGFGVTVNNGAGNNSLGQWMVQINYGNWYISTNTIKDTGLSPADTFTYNFTPAAGAWENVSVSGTGSFIPGINTNVVIGAATVSPLTGFITGGGILVNHPTHTEGNFQFNDYVVLGAIPPTNVPVINAPPFTRTNYTGTTATFTVEATTNGSTAGLTYQWEDGTVGSGGPYTPLSNGGQFSGVTTPTLTITNVSSAANHKDYIVVVSDTAGSTTNTTPATLWVVDSGPRLSSDTTMYPDDAPDLSSTSNSITAGNNNVMNLTASFIGDLPMTYQWQFSPDEVNISNVSGGTNSSLSLSNISTNASGYYRLTASNSQGGPSNSDWVALTVFPASTAQIQWAAKVPFSGLTATQILSGALGSFYEAEAFAFSAFNPSISDVYVTNGIGGTNVFAFDTTGASATLATGYTPWTGQFSGTTGDAGLDSVFNDDYESYQYSTVTLNNLVVSNEYNVQLFCFSDAGSLGRQSDFYPTNNPADVSQAFTMGDSVYVAGTFTATNSTEPITFGGDSGCYMCCVVVYNVLPTPTLSIQKSGSSVQVTYANGTLLQASSLKGPWTTNSTASPVTITPTPPAMFYKVVAP
jgi:hypothetical protein